MMHLHVHHRRVRGLTLLELLLALSITAFVAGAIAGMLGAVSSGVGSNRDNRTVMVSANAAQTRLSSYLAPARCALEQTSTSLTLWFNDARQGGSVHASEIRWLMYNADAGTIDVHYVDFPDGWSQAAQDLEDAEYPLASTNWGLVLKAYRAAGWTSKRTLVDGLSDVTIHANSVTATNSRHFTFDLEFAGEQMSVPMTASCTIRLHSVPTY